MMDITGRIESGDQIGRLIDPGVIVLLLTILETGGFATAAARLGISQPSVSQHVKRLETAIGRTLFRRTRRGVQLTAEGEAVIVYARAILDLTDDLQQQLGRIANGAEITVGMSEDFCRTALPRVLRLFMLDYPTVRIKVISGDYDTIAQSIHDSSVDFAITRRYEKFASSETVFSCELCWYGSSDLPLPVSDPVPLVVPLAPNPSRSTVISCLRDAGRPFSIRFESVGVAGVETALAAGLGVCAGPKGMALLNVLPLPPGHGLPALPTVEYVMTQSKAVLNTAAEAFSQIIRNAAKSSFSVDDEATPQS